MLWLQSVCKSHSIPKTSPKTWLISFTFQTKACLFEMHWISSLDKTRLNLIFAQYLYTLGKIRPSPNPNRWWCYEWSSSTLYIVRQALLPISKPRRSQACSSCVTWRRTTDDSQTHTQATHRPTTTRRRHTQTLKTRAPSDVQRKQLKNLQMHSHLEIERNLWKR